MPDAHSDNNTFNVTQQTVNVITHTKAYNRYQQQRKPKTSTCKVNTIKQTYDLLITTNNVDWYIRPKPLCPLQRSTLVPIVTTVGLMPSANFRILYTLSHALPHFIFFAFYTCALSHFIRSSRKLHTGFRLVPTLMTLNDRNAPLYFTLYKLFVSILYRFSDIQPMNNKFVFVYKCYIFFVVFQKT